MALKVSLDCYSQNELAGIVGKFPIRHLISQGALISRKRCLGSQRIPFVACRDLTRPALESREAVCAPFVAADAVMGEEQAIRIITFFDRRQTIEIWAPIGLFPVRIEIVGFGQV
jgi:hypothetical protein